jgi:hypothetical protein
MSVEIIVALIGAGAVVSSAIIAGIFALKNKRNKETNVEIPKVDIDVDESVVGDAIITGNRNVALIGAGAVVSTAIIAGIFALKNKRNKETNDEKSKVDIKVDGGVVSSAIITGNENNVIISQQKEDANIRVIDVLFDADDDGQFCIDIKVSNKGDKVAFIKRVEFSVFDTFNMRNPQIMHQYCFMPVYPTYDVVLNSDSKQSFVLSQKVNANDVDRFKISCCSAIADVPMPAIYRLSFSLIYDDNKFVETNKYIVAIPQTVGYNACYVSPIDSIFDTSAEIAKANYLELKKFAKLEGVQVDNFKDILKSYEDNKDDFMNT